MAKNHDSGKTHQPKHNHGEESRPLRDVAAAVAEQTGEMVHTARDKGQEALEGAKETVATLPERAACQMKHAAEQIRENLPQEGQLGNVAHKVADGLDSGATYLKEHDLNAIGEDLAGIIRSHPIPLVLAGVGLGFLLGRTIRS